MFLLKETHGTLIWEEAGVGGAAIAGVSRGRGA